MIETATSTSMASQVLVAIRNVTGPGKISLHEPAFTGNEWEYLKECLDSTFVSSVGSFVDRLAIDLQDYTGVAYAVPMVNGTAALHLALTTVGVLAGDEVLMPALTFVATANAATYCGAVPHFIDAEDRSLGVDAAKLEDYLEAITEQRQGNCINKQTGRVIRALVVMHTFGHPSDLENCIRLAEDYNITLVEDAAESLGSIYKGRHTGTFGKVSALSFNGNKTITTGGGGAILTNDPSIASKARHLSTTAKVAHDWEYKHDAVGFNYRMPNINAALGCAQLEKLDELVEGQRTLYRLYAQEFKGIDKIELFKEPEGCKSNYWLQSLILLEEDDLLREKILEVTNGDGIMCRPVWKLMHQLPPFRDCPRMTLDCAQSLAARIINIPSSPILAKTA
jgi:perosamine synthetase